MFRIEQIANNLQLLPVAGEDKNNGDKQISFTEILKEK